MRYKDFEFSLRELAGSMGDFGTLFPLAIGYIVVCGMNPSGLLVMMGLINIASGIIYRQPMPVEPMKALAVAAISQKWAPSLIYATGFGTGVAWVVFAFSGLIQRIAQITPRNVVRGIQATLGIMLGIEGIKLIAARWSWGSLSLQWVLGALAIVIILTLRENRYAPATIVLMVMGVVIVGLKGELGRSVSFGFSLPPLTTFRPVEIWGGFVRAGFAQLFLTASNAVIATAAVIKKYWPERPVAEKRLALNMGIMNCVLPFFGGMPMCHGSGGYVGQYYFGARTAGANLMEGTLELSLGLFLSRSIAGIFAVFPKAIIGGMMLMVGVEFVKFVRDLKLREMPIMVFTTALSIATNMAIGFIAGMVVYHLLSSYGRNNKYLGWAVKS
ncbi:MAG: putative sulfate/molybdate transporter [Chloroflexota bacterium]